jgi:translocation protein SEC66
MQWLHAVIYVFGIFLAVTIYKKYSIKTQKTSSYFPPHTTRKRYLELSEIHDPSDPIDHKLLATALLKRAITDIGRIMQIRTEKAPLQNLVQTGAISHSIFDNLVKAEEELEEEVQAVMMEAEIYKRGWGKTIFNEASNLFNLQKQQQETKETKESVKEEKVDDDLNVITEEERLELQKELIREEESGKKKKKKK